MQLTAESFLFLHEVRLRGLVETDEDELVVTLVDAGLVARVRTSVRITPAGREVHTTWARTAEGSDSEAAAARAYEQFLPLNTELIRVCHDWQVRPGDVPNDHSDVRYDWEVVDRLRNVDERTRPVIRRLGRTVERFEAYPRRLRQALVQLEEGHHDWFVSPRIDSYHTVWMQMHEDLLLALGIERASEGSA